MESTRSRSRSPDEDSRHHHPKPEYKSNEEESKNDSSTTSNMPVLSATATPEDEEKPTYNIWAGDLDPAVTEHDLMGAFEMCGNIHSASIVRDRVNGTSRGYGFVNFTTPESRKMALEKYGDSVTLYGRKVKIVMSDSKNSIYIGALPKDTREEDLRAKVQEWAGPFEHLYFKPQTGYAFVEYINHMKAEKAYQLMKNQTFMGVAIKVQPAQSREKKAKFQQQQQHQANIPQSTTLFFKNIHESIDSDKLKDYVSRFGDVTKATVINNPQTGKSKGFGFVEFSSLKDSLHAQKALDGIMWNAQRLSVEFSVKDRDRRGGAAGPSGGRGLPPHLHPGGYGGYDMPRMHDPRDLRFASAYDRGYPSVYSDRDPRDSRDRDRASSRRTRDPLYDATPYYVDPRIAAAYGAYPDPYAEYGYADAYADYPRTAAVSAARDYDRDRVRYPDERLDERVSSRTLRERSDRDRTPTTTTATTSDRDRDRIRDRDRYATPTVPAVAADHLAMMDRYGAYALLEQQYRGAGATAPRAGAGAGAAGTDRDADYLRSQSRGYRY